MAELSSQAQEAGIVSRTTALCLLTTMAMFFRNLILATLFSPRSLSATLVPLFAMTLVAGLLVWRDRTTNLPSGGTVTLASPIALGKVLRFGKVFIVIQIAGTLLKFLGSSGMLVIGAVGGLVSSASTTAAGRHDGRARTDQPCAGRKRNRARITCQRDR